MDKFFAFCGEFIRYEIQEIGQASHKQFNVWYYYTNGTAMFDGHNWRFSQE